MPVTLYNTMERKLEEFIPIEDRQVRLYCCGPTVYNYAHVGNLRTYVFEDILRRTLEYYGYSVRHVMNVTDVGHLVGDGDDGEDKMEKTSKETGKSVYEIADFYADAFFADTADLNILTPTVACRATEHIDDMIALVKRLEERGHTYTAGGNVYFSIDTFPAYGRLARLDLEELRSGARIEVDSNKRNPKDFVLWFTRSKFGNQSMTWDSPWGVGYPGWHLECSAMSMRYLGEQFDIHCGGTDHIPVHHTNEIAQSEAATGKSPWVKYWMHAEFLLDESGKMSKSKGEFLTLSLLKKKGYDPMDFRYFCLGGHYRSQLQFSYRSLDAARTARLNMSSRVQELLAAGAEPVEVVALSDRAVELRADFIEQIGHDLNMPRALSTLWAILKDTVLSPSEKITLLYDIDKVLGLRIDKIPSLTDEELDEECASLIREREEARRAKNYSRADELRDILKTLGIEIKDTPSGTKWKKIL
ncbi:MAG: cysteine--tRNA ligase [Spirochaetia bacterium]|nr:cysteine--tRNA ligase [Spirochaetia bacterium]